MRSAINSQATATLTFTIASGCGITTVSRTINVGSPARPNLSINGLTNPSARVEMNQSALATITSSSAISSWSVSAGLTIISQNSSSITFRADTPGFASVNGFRTNSCGTSGRAIGIHVLEPGAGPSPFVVTPNPADDLLGIAYDGNVMAVDSQLSSTDGVHNYSATVNKDRAFSVRLFNSRQELVLTAESSGEGLQLDVSQLQPGIYVLHIHTKEAVLPRKIIIL